MIKKLANAVILVFIGLYSLSFLAPYIDPNKSWVIALLGLAFPYLFVVGIIISVFLFTGSNRLKWLLIFVLAPGIFKMSLFYRFGSTEKTSSDTSEISILSYNVRSFNRYRWIESDQITPEIISLVADKNPDVFFIQEFYASSPEIRDSLVESIKTKCKLPYYASFQSRANGKANGLYTFSRYPIDDVSEEKFNKGGVNGILACSILFKGKKIRLLNFHLQSYQLTTAEETKLEKEQRIKNAFYKLRNGLKNRSSQVKMLREKVLSYSLRGPLICGGDLNDTPHSYAYRSLTDFLYDSYNEAGHGEGKTYAGKLPGFRIDYVLHNDKLKAVHYQSIKEKKSDHYPILVGLKLE